MNAKELLFETRLSDICGIKSIFHFEYKVINSGSLFSRQGVLLKFVFQDNSIGFSDLMAWPELGDGTIEQELEILKETPKGLSKLSLLTSQVVRNAFIDAQARAQSFSLWNSSISMPKSHFFVGGVNEFRLFMRSQTLERPQLAKDTVVKVKWSEELSPELIEDSPYRLRIDFNEKGTPKSLNEILVDSNVRDRIDFIEDPFAFNDRTSWKWLQEVYPEIKVFGDFALEKNRELENHCTGVVLKPASRSTENWLKTNKEICVTHSLGHFYGQMIAGCYAAHLVNKSISTGLLPNQNVLDSKLEPWLVGSIPKGEGFGYETERLLNLEWNPL
jgi:hypothetical protein